MKSLIGRLSLLATLAGLAVLGRTTPALAAEEGGVPAERLERLEQRVNEMAERQEHFMREMGGQMERVGAQMERRGAVAQAGPENLRQPMPPPQDLRRPLPPGGAPPAAKLVKGISNTLRFCFLIGIICNILMAVWIFADIRKRGEGSAIFVAMAVLAGIPAALIYALTRLGDKKASAP